MLPAFLPSRNDPVVQRSRGHSGPTAAYMLYLWKPIVVSEQSSVATVYGHVPSPCVVGREADQVSPIDSW